MDQFKVPATGSMTPSLVVLIGLMALVAILATRLRESALISERQ
jgi:LPXTG-motif cell wall-anchored protein